MSDQPKKTVSKKRITLIDVAKDAEVSRATASLVLRGSSLVSSATRERVHASMKKLGYVYNRAAASLRAQSSHAIGLAVTDITNPFFAELVISIEARMDDKNYSVLMMNTSENLDKQERFLQSMHGYQADGLLLCPAPGTSQDTIEQLKLWQLPCVLIARHVPDIDYDYVGADNIAGTTMAVEHLLSIGHQRIAFLGGSARSSARQERLTGYKKTLSSNKIEFDPSLTVESPVSRDGGFAAVKQLLQLSAPPTAAICYNDVVAFGAMLGLQSESRQPGVDFGIIGFDNIADAALVRPALTSISIPPAQIGEAAAQLLLARISDPTMPVQRVILQPELVIRDSCGFHR